MFSEQEFEAVPAGPGQTYPFLRPDRGRFQHSLLHRRRIRGRPIVQPIPVRHRKLPLAQYPREAPSTRHRGQELLRKAGRRFWLGADWRGRKKNAHRREYFRRARHDEGHYYNYYFIN